MFRDGRRLPIMQEPGQGFEKKLQHEREMPWTIRNRFARIGFFLGFLGNRELFCSLEDYPSMSGGNRLRAYL